MKKGIALVFINICLLSLHAADLKHVVGGREGFKDFTSFRDVILTPVDAGETAMTLKNRTARSDETADLILGFDAEPLREETGGYEPLNEGVVLSFGHKIRGAGSGAFQRGAKLTLRPGKKTLFSSGTVWRDFTVEFWLYPAALEEGETVFSWHGSKPTAGKLLGQEASCRVAGRTLHWDFRNFFQAADRPKTEISLQGRRQLIPREWHHHLLRFDSSTGLLEYLVDGSTEDIVHASRTGREDGSVLVPLIGKDLPGPLVLGNGFTGFIDDFRISRQNTEKPGLAAYGAEGGLAETELIDLGYTNSKLKRLESRYTTPSNSAVFFFYKTANTAAEMKTMEWTPVLPGTDIPENVRGRFVLLRLELYPDGYRKEAPRVSEVSLIYERNLPPPPPSQVAVIPGDGKATLTWSAVSDPSVEGFLVYYGESPGVYDGNESGLGPSPIKVGKIRSLVVDGLINGKLYYFAVSAYDASDDPLSGLFSREVSIRPSRLYRDENKEKK